MKIVKAPLTLDLRVVVLTDKQKNYDKFHKFVEKFGYTDEIWLFQAITDNGRPALKFTDNRVTYDLVLGNLFTDLASVPEIPGISAQFKLLQPIAPVFHDQAYVVNTDGDNSDGYWMKDGIIQKGRMPFDLANLMYKTLLIYYGVSNEKAESEYLALKTFGHSHYDEYKEIK